jgi:hypothetical protein
MANHIRKKLSLNLSGFLSVNSTNPKPSVPAGLSGVIFDRGP